MEKGRIVKKFLAVFYISIKVTLSYLFTISKDSSCGEVKLVEDTGMLPL